MYATLTLPFVDADRGNPTGPNRGRISPRLWIVLAYLALVAVWLVARVNGYWR